ncbi:hypothetical protein [Oceaniradius stylonematis]|uniref:hypothetical protein n=1 Tax=Oceaniradius stylonematis TaxID=2184161 RepID=UPI00273F0A7F|nr:hypothetical protein [Oceaniradius stylonematis]
MTQIFQKLAREIFAPTNADGTPRGASMADAMTWGTTVEQRFAVGEISDLDAYGPFSGRSTHDGEATGFTYGVTDDASGDLIVYIKETGTSGDWAGPFTMTAPSAFVTATVTGGTANAIEASTSPTLVATDGAQLVYLTPTADNTSTSMTVAFDGGSPMTIETASGNGPAVGGVQNGVGFLGFRTDGGTVFRMLSDQASANILAAIEAIQTDVQADADRADAAAALAGRLLKGSVRVATTAAGTLASDFEAGDTHDGVVLADGDRILIKNQTDPVENGIYVVNASDAPTRADDFDSGTDVTGGLLVFVREGTVNAVTHWTLTNIAAVTIGTTGLSFTEFTSGGASAPGDAIDPASYGAAGDGTTDDTTAVANAVAAAAYRTVDLKGRTYRLTGATSVGSVPDGARIINGRIVLDGDANQIGFDVQGTETSLTYSAGTISAGATTVTVAGLTSDDVGKYLFISSDDSLSPTAAPTYKKGEMVAIRGVSGSTVTLAHAVRETYSTSPAVALVDPKRDVSIDLDFAGDPAKTQIGVRWSRTVNARGDTRGRSVGNATQQVLRSINGRFRHAGDNHLILTDNGLDYGISHGNGNIGCTFECDGEAYRHCTAGGAEDGVDYDIIVRASGRAMKDSVVDCHPNVVNFSGRISGSGLRTGGIFSSQATFFTYQGGGAVDVDINGYQWDSVAVLLQPMQNTDDAFHVSGRFLRPASTVTYGVRCDVQKAAGKLDLLFDCITKDLASTGARALEVDTASSGAGFEISTIDIRGHYEAEAYCTVIIIRDGRTCRHVRNSASAKILGGSGDYGHALIRVGTGAYAASHFVATHVDGPAGGIAHLVEGVSEAKAIGTTSIGVGGAALTTNALRGTYTYAGSDNTYT